MKSIIPSKAQLVEDTATLSAHEIMAKYGTASRTLYGWWEQYGIKPSQHTKYSRRYAGVEVTERQKAVMWGTLLGDASVDFRQRTFSLGHCTKQKGYLEWKAKELGALVTPSGIRRAVAKSGPGRPGEDKEFYQFTLVAHPWVKGLRDVFYRDQGSEKGPKVMPEQIISGMPLLSWALWYLDDGHLDTYNGGRVGWTVCREVGARGVEFMCGALTSRLGYRSNVHEDTGNLTFSVRLRLDDSRDFLGKIRALEQWPECMQYKMDWSG